MSSVHDRVGINVRLALLRGILDQQPAATAAWERGGTVLEHNSAFAQLVGREGEDLAGTSLADLLSGADGAGRLQVAQDEALQAGKSTVRLTTSSGASALVELTDCRVGEDPFFCGVFLSVLDSEVSPILEALERAVFAVNLEGRVIFWNREAENFYGLPASEALGQEVGRLLPGHPLEALGDSTGRRVPEECLGEGECTVRLNRTGNVSLTVRRTAVSIVDDEGSPTGVLDLACDIEHAATPRARRDVEAALQVARELVAVVDRSYVVTLANPTYLRYQGRERDQVIGQTLVELVGQELLEHSLRPVLDRGFEGEETHLEVVRHYPRLGRRHLLVSHYPVRDASGEVSHVAAVIRDVTTQRSLAYERQASLLLLELLNSAGSVGELMHGATTILRNATGCRAVAIRLQGEGDYRFVACSGLSPEFMEAENSLLNENGLGDSSDHAGSLECLCGSVIQGRLPRDLPCVTEGGSLWTGCASELAQAVDLGSLIWGLRGRCIEIGMESLVLVPLRTREGTVGLLYVADKRRDMVDRESVGFLEELSANLAVGLERLTAEAARRASEERYRSFMGAFQGIAYRGRMDFVPEFFHGAVETITGYTEAEFTAGTPRWDQIIHPEDKPRVMASVGRLMTEPGFSEERRYRIIRKDGEVRWVQEFISNVPEPAEGHPYRVQGTIHDITDRVRAGERIEELAADLARERDVLQTVMENTHAQLAYLDPDMKFVMANTSYVSACGHSREELIGRNHFELFPNEENQAIFERVRDTGEPVRLSEKPFEYADQPERGVTYWDWTLVPVKDGQGRVQGLVFSLLDVTESVLARQWVEDLARQIQQHASQLEATMAAIADGLMVYRETGEIASMNDAARDLLGYSESSYDAPMLERIGLLDVRGPDGLAILPGETAPARALRGETVRSETVSIRPPGSTRRLWLSLSASPIRDADGAIQGAVMTMSDVTPLREAQNDLQEANEELLVQSEELQAQAEELLAQREQLQDLALEIEGERARLKAVIDNAPEGIIVADGEARVLLANPTAERIYGVPLQDPTRSIHLPPLQRPDGSPIPESERPLVRSAREGVALHGVAAQFVGADGVCRDLLINSAPFFAFGGGVAGAVVVVQDVTELREAERQRQALLERLQVSEAELRQINERLRQEVRVRAEAERRLDESQRLLQRTFDGLRDAVFVVSAEDDVVLDCNPAASETFGYTREEMLGKCTRLFYVDDESYARFNRLRDDSIAGQGFLMMQEFPMRRRDETTFPSERMVTPLEDEEGRRLGYICSVRDVSERLKLEQMKSEFVASVSHELRSPLASIMGYTEILLDGGPGELTTLQKDFLGTVYESSQRLEWLINDLLDVSRMETGRYTLKKQQLQLQELVQGALDNMRPTAAEKSVRLAMEIRRPLPVLEVDGRRLRQVLDNLLSNAIKFTSAGGQVTLVADVDQAGVVVEVRDTGIGIPEADLPRVFERFYRAGNASGEERGGTGLGLYIAHSIVEAHGGTMEVESQLGRGSAFRVCLPIDSQE